MAEGVQLHYTRFWRDYQMVHHMQASCLLAPDIRASEHRHQPAKMNFPLESAVGEMPDDAKNALSAALESMQVRDRWGGRCLRQR
jgi:hypothetical protein